MNILSKAFQWTFLWFRCVPKPHNHSLTNRRLPGPRGYPIIGNLFDLIRIPKNLCRLRRNYQPACQIQVFEKKIVFLNSLQAINSVFRDQETVTSDRPKYFFQQYVFENNGFGFNDYDIRVSHQKCILSKYLDGKKTECSHDISRLVNLIKRVGEQDVDINIILKSFLTDQFTRQVGL